MKPTIPGRLHAQGLTSRRLTTAVDVVRHLGCVQSQLPEMALWSVARRMGPVTLTDLWTSFDDGDFLRTHVLRPTWHFVEAADLGWLLALTAPRIRQSMSSAWKAMGLTSQLLEQGTAVIVQALADGPRSRTELQAALAAAGLESSGQFAVHHLMNAEIDGAIVSGPMRGKQNTYTLFRSEHTVPARDELLARVARRYARGHGAFRAKDLAWWTSLTLTDSRRAIELAQLRPLVGDADAYWTLDEPVEDDVPPVMLLSNYDEYISYARDPEDFELFAGSPADILRGAGLLMLDGRLSGTWSRTLGPTSVRITVTRAPTLTPAQRRALDDEATALGRFLQRDPQVVPSS